MRRCLVLLAVVVVGLGGCGGDDKKGGTSSSASDSSEATSATTVEPTTEPAETDATTVPTTSAGDEETRDAAGEAVDYWLTESFYPGADISDVRECLVDALVRDLTPDEIDAIQYLDPEHSDASDVAAVELAIPVLDECIDAETFATMAIASFEELGEFDPECAATILVDDYTIGETIRLFFANAGEDEPAAEFIELFERLYADCPL